MDMAQVKEFLAFEAAKKKLEAKTKEIAQKLTNLQELIIPQMVADGMQAVTVNGRHLTIVEYLYAGPVEGDKEGVIDALKSSDETSCFVAEGYNPQKLQSYVREVAAGVEAACKQDGRVFDLDMVRAALKSDLSSAIKISFEHKLRSTKA